MNVLVFGATGGTGRALVEQALEQGHFVTAFARDPAKVKVTNNNLRVAQGNILNYESVGNAVRGQDAVLSALGVKPMVGTVIIIAIACQVIARTAGLSGPLAWLVRLVIPVLVVLAAQRKTTTLSDGTKNILRAMEKTGVRRFICESSLGVAESYGQLGPFFTWFFIPVFLRHLFVDKDRQEKAIQQSGTDWVIVRPGALTNGPRTGKYHSWSGTPDVPIKRRISRRDIADFMLRQLTEDDFWHKSPGLSY